MQKRRRVSDSVLAGVLPALGLRKHSSIINTRGGHLTSTSTLTSPLPWAVINFDIFWVLLSPNTKCGERLAKNCGARTDCAAHSHLQCSGASENHTCQGDPADGTHICHGSSLGGCQAASSAETHTCHGAELGETHTCQAFSESGTNAYEAASDSGTQDLPDPGTNTCQALPTAGTNSNRQCPWSPTCSSRECHCKDVDSTITTSCHNHKAPRKVGVCSYGTKSPRSCSSVSQLVCKNASTPHTTPTRQHVGGCHGCGQMERKMSGDSGVASGPKVIHPCCCCSCSTLCQLHAIKKVC